MAVWFQRWARGGGSGSSAPPVGALAAAYKNGLMASETNQTVSRVINAPASDIFDALSNPDRHTDFDGSGFVRSADKPQRIQKVGDVFRMNMEGDHMGGEYQTDNHVVGFSDGKLIAWKTAPAGTEPPGWEWVYELKSEGSDSTEVTLTYDWSAVTDKDLLKKITFPLVSADAMEGSLAQLAAAVNG
jgi:uncharacterized protein YndB with AHSA1/START domain